MKNKETNQSLHRYIVEDVLKLFTPSSNINLVGPEEIISQESLWPILKNKSIKECMNSCKNNLNKELLPEWYTEDAFVTQNNCIKIEDIEEKYSKIDVKYEENIKNIDEEDEKYPDWDDSNEIEEAVSISYPMSLINENANEGNPFACIIMNNSLQFEGQFIPDLDSIPFEKVWFYKDPQNNIQGPFNANEMFNWSAAGFFYSKLQIAHSTPVHFFSLQMYILEEKSKKISNWAK